MMSWKYCWAPTNSLGLQASPPSHTQLQLVSTFLGWWLLICSWRWLIIESHLFALQKTKSFPPRISRDEQIHIHTTLWSGDLMTPTLQNQSLRIWGLICKQMQSEFYYCSWACPLRILSSNQIKSNIEGSELVGSVDWYPVIRCRESIL